MGTGVRTAVDIHQAPEILRVGGQGRRGGAPEDQPVPGRPPKLSLEQMRRLYTPVAETDPLGTASNLGSEAGRSFGR